MQTVGAIVGLILLFGIPIVGWIYAGRQPSGRRRVTRAVVVVYTVTVWGSGFVLVMAPSKDAEVTLPTFTTE